MTHRIPNWLLTAIAVAALITTLTLYLIEGDAKGTTGGGSRGWATPIAVDDPPVTTDGTEEVPVYELPATGSGSSL